ncbi:NADH-FMN oxidoreductase RutF, flavin reductase (DIM6/NTAB) family [Roseovarius nanhaiticus]|uniref:NADH-FMN oxidoreductase RutF, flavin reductase (DIM6/NTAB) family n=1 Tax=Roseovarius nanhaiticus TaxID=573024 RepID=A0A1N7HLF6_9RHOB|nr:flavin reductase family protein [Roseovarius nanhaiticus]SEL27760.1 NADH-FMN oxidoreductase RutF, flavin reductase (DIM6/NTAB) family [Roseovarius nanhaiticus]SIS25652.1 NADH-FMN oxidoreductase RutF, flavin reductase (DIM6/NTAB) family [Roseovarius nanhaiticus]
MTVTDTRALRDAFGRFATGVTVMTTREGDGTPRGFTANSFSSVSLDPPLVLVCIGNNAHSGPAFRAAPHFAVNVLADAQRDVAKLFASRSEDRFDRTEWHAGPHDLPLLPGSLATLICAQHKLVEAGDHVVLIGEVLETQISDGPALGYHRGEFITI